MAANYSNDIDPLETRDWLDALASVLENDGPERAHYLLEQLVTLARQGGADVDMGSTTEYVNTIPVAEQAPLPGNSSVEDRLRALVRWNALAVVVRANKGNDMALGGHIASYQSASVLYETGFNHFWHAPSDGHGGDLVYTQGHSAPGIYARAFLEGRLTEEQMINFRQEVGGKGLSSYPHPWLMPDFWQFPTVSMGLGPLMGIYQARFMKYLENRGLAKTADRRVWVFCGDGEMDEPESLGAIGVAAREKLDNLVFVINCNLQRLDGPVRGNGKIIQELESEFKGSGWNVIKVVWGSKWDVLLAKDKTGLLKKRMMECVDGDYQTFKARDGAYVREHFFGKYPELLELVADMTDEEVWALSRGGQDIRKVYAAYHQAVNEANGKPTVILAKTVKGDGMGGSGEGQNTSHQQKKMDMTDIKGFRDRFKIPLTDEEVEKVAFYKPAEDSPEMQFMHARRNTLGGYLPARHPNKEPLKIPALSAFDALLKDSEGREFSTTMAFVRLLGVLLKDKQIGQRIVPIVPDESRTFGMEGLFRQLGIWSQVGQNYVPQDHDQLMFYKETVNGQILQEGINEPGAMSSWIAAATAYANHGIAMIPFYIYYSMFGFQRIGDLAWAAGDLRARGFMLGGTAGRTTLNGEGLQHEDGHSHVQASLIPNCVSYDPTFAYELAVIMQDGLRRMYVEHEDVFYYLTVMNENYAHPAMPKGAETGILKGIYQLRKVGKGKTHVNLMGSGTIFNEVIAAADLLDKDFGVASTLWSVTSFNQLRRDGMEVTRWNRLHPTSKKPQVPYLTQQLQGSDGPFVAATDYVRTYADQVREYVPGHYSVLGTDGFGRSDSRAQLRSFFEVDRYHVTVAALKALADEGKIPAVKVAEALKKYKLNADKLPSWQV